MNQLDRPIFKVFQRLKHELAEFPETHDFLEAAFMDICMIVRGSDVTDIDETLDFPKGDPREHVSPNTTIEDYRPPNAPPTCEGCE